MVLRAYGVTAGTGRSRNDLKKLVVEMCESTVAETLIADMEGLAAPGPSGLLERALCAPRLEWDRSAACNGYDGTVSSKKSIVSIPALQVMRGTVTGHDAVYSRKASYQAAETACTLADLH